MQQPYASGEEVEGGGTRIGAEFHKAEGIDRDGGAASKWSDFAWSGCGARVALGSADGRTLVLEADTEGQGWRCIHQDNTHSLLVNRVR